MKPNREKLITEKPTVFAVSIILGLALIFSAGAQDKAKPNPHAAGQVKAAGTDEVKYCMSCHTAGCTMPHPEGPRKAAVTWPTNGRTVLANGAVTCGSCHTPGFRHRGDAFLARDQKGLCSNCHFGDHALPNAHPYKTACESCHTAPKASLVAGARATASMVADIDAECLKCHYDGPITHPVGIPNSKKKCDLPLSRDGQITCVTCHFGHSNQNGNGQLLRMNNRRGALCLSCHDDL